MSLKHNEPKNIDKDTFLKNVSEGVVVLVCQSIVNAVHSISDYDWLLEQFCMLLNNPEMQIRGVTVSSIGHLARLNKQANKKQLLKILQPLLSDDEISGRVEDAIDDVNMFLTKSMGSE